MYENNYDILCQVVETDGVIRHVSKHRNPDGTLDITGKIAVMGFSAGGMLGGNCATHYDLGRSGAEDVIEQHSCRPDAAVVCYGAFAPLSFPGGMFRTLFKGTREQQYYLSVEHNVTCDTPPFFI